MILAVAPALEICLVSRPRWLNQEHRWVVKMPTHLLTEKAAALGYALCQNHGFIDGNKRMAHVAMEVFLVLNGEEISASVDEQEKQVLALAAGDLSRESLAEWLAEHITPV